MQASQVMHIPNVRFFECVKQFVTGIRDHIISKSACVCGATNVLADDLLPNKTLRDTINRILESGGNSSADNAGSTFQVQGMIIHPFYSFGLSFRQWCFFPVL